MYIVYTDSIVIIFSTLSRTMSDQAEAGELVVTIHAVSPPPTPRTPRTPRTPSHSPPRQPRPTTPPLTPRTPSPSPSRQQRPRTPPRAPRRRARSPSPPPQRSRSPYAPRERFIINVPRVPENQGPIFDWGCLVILSLPGQQDDRDWKKIFQQNHYALYDILYPFRMSARLILRQKEGNLSLSSHQVEDLARKLFAATIHAMAPNFIIDQFLEYYKRETPRKVCVFGLIAPVDMERHLQEFRKFKAIMVGPPEIRGCDVHVETPQNADAFLRTEVSSPRLVRRPRLR